MKQILKRSLALCMALVLCIGLLPAIQIAAAETVQYVTGSNGYIYNWGVREEVATFLSPNAKEFYTGDNTYDVLSSYSGGTGSSDAPKSQLYAELKELMVSNHKYQTSYDATKNMYQYTDCEKSGGKISSFYSGVAIGPSWGSSPSWNREHTWPNSKGLGGNDENDIMMLRPTASTENSSRGNKAYGVSSGFYNPNSASNGAHDLRGDVARIFLYVYVRWGNTNGNGEYATWGTRGVIESVDVLLDWMEADPVDTWELGRNDSVESITGTRNVFVDYPEFAFILFGEEIPNDMATPSGEAKDAVGCEHNYVAGKPVAATCTTKGYTLYTCTKCGKSYQDKFTDKTAHNYVGGSCTVCKASESGLPGTGDKVVIYAPAYNMALSADKVATYYNVGVDISGGFDSIPDAATWVVTVNSDGTYSFVSKTGKKLALAGDYSSLNDTGSNDDWKVTAKAGADGIFYIQNVARGNYLEWYASKNNWSTYATSNLSDLFELSFYFVSEETACAHTNTKTEGAKAAGCTTEGHTGKTVCADCGATVNAGTTISATGHNYVNGTCSVCGKEKPNAGTGESTTVTVNIVDYAAANGWENSKQYLSMKMNDVVSVAVSGGVNTGKFYANGNNWRMYQTESPNIVLSAADGATIVSVKISYTSEKTGVLTLNGANVASDEVVAVNAASVTFNVGNSGSATNGQARITAIEVVYAVAAAECKHTETIVEGAKTPNCTTPGHTGKTVCADCGEVLDAGKAIAATGHNYVGGVCSACGKAESVGGDVSSNKVSVSIADYAAANGWVDSVKYPSLKLNDYISVAVSGGENTGKYYNNGTNWRMYQTENPSIVISAADGLTIVSVKISYASQKTGVLTLNGANIESDQVVNVNASSVEFSVGNTGSATNGQARITAIEVVYAAATADDTCNHNNTKTEGAKAPTCTAAGHTGKTVCSDCGATINAGQTIAAAGHNYVDGTCTACGDMEAVVGPTEPSTEPSIQPTKPAEPSYKIELIEKPQAGESYIAGMAQNNIGKTLYVTGNTVEGKDHWLETTEDASKAVQLQLEAVDGGYYLYFMKDGVKTYIEIYEYTKEGDKYPKGSLKLTTEKPASVLVYNEEYKTLVAVFGENSYYMGTYNTYNTVSVSSTYYISGDKAGDLDKTQFPLRFYAEVEVDNSTTGDNFTALLPICIIAATGLALAALLVIKQKRF